MREGLDTLPAAHLDGPELDLRLLVDHRDGSSDQRVAINNTLQWHLHDLWPDLQFPGSALFHGTWGPRIARRLARAEQTMRVRIARDELRRIRELTQTIKALEAEIADLVAQIAPQLLTEPGFGPLDRGQARRRDRRRPALRQRRQARPRRRHRPDSGQLRQHQPPPARPRRQPPDQRHVHRIAVTRLRCHPETQDYIARKRAEGKSTKDAIRCLKRHLTRRIWHLLQTPAPIPDQTLTPSIS